MPSMGLSWTAPGRVSRINGDTMTQDEVGMASADAAFRIRRRKELLVFLALAFGIWPIVAVGIVGSYGFAVWMWQAVFGPPGPPAG